jgi:hypothetical protein
MRRVFVCTLFSAFGGLLILASTGCDKSSGTPPEGANTAAVPTISASARGSVALAASATGTAVATAATAASGGATAAAPSSVQYTCTVQVGEVALDKDAKRAGPKDPDPALGTGDAIFVLTIDKDGNVAGTGTGAFGATTVGGLRSDNRIIATFGPESPAITSFRGTLDLDLKTGGSLRASTGNGESARAGTCTIKQ